MELKFNHNIEDIKYMSEMTVNYTGGRVITFSIQYDKKEWAYFDLDVDEFKKIVKMIKDVEE